MGGHTKSSCHENGMFGHLCKAYRCFMSRRQKKHSPRKHKSLPDIRPTDGYKSFDETCKGLNDKKEARRSTNDLIHGGRSHDDNEVHPSYDIPSTPKLNKNKSSSSIFTRMSSASHTSKKSTLFRSTSQTVRSHTSEAQSKLMRSLTGQSVDTREPKNEGPLRKSSSGNNFNRKAHSSGPLFRSASRTGDIVYSNLNGLSKLSPIEQNLECTLEDLCFGCLKKITIDRNAIASNGKIVKETETLSIKVEPGWKKGTKIAFEGTKNKDKGTQSCVVNFVITEKKHTLYRREGDDLELVVRISLLQSLTGCTLCIPLLGGDKLNLELDEIIVPGYEKIITGQGMPKSKEGQRGDLKLKFLVDFPTELTEDQRNEIVTILQDSF